MQATCSQCQKILEFSGEAPKFCAYCGQALSAPTEEFILDSGTDSGTEALSQSAEPGVNTPTLPPLPAGILPTSGFPDVVGGYKVLRRLGGGGMGTVYEAEDSASGRRVALKLVLPDYAGSPEAILRFRQEGRLASSVSHPRCVFVLAADEEAGRPYIVMELMPGNTLDDLVRAKGPLPPEEAIAKILDVIDGLQEAHRLGLVHRDVKPSNCFLEKDGHVKIGDFGLARSLMHDSKLTRTGTFIGTPLFASPEQIKMETVDAQSDLYAVAATLYFLLTGKAPFHSGDMMATMARIVSDDPPPMRTKQPKLSRALDKVVLRGLQRDRKRRWRDLEEFRRALMPFLPAKPSMVGASLRTAAYVIDNFVIGLISAIPTIIILGPVAYLEMITGSEGRKSPSLLGMVVGGLVFLLYFGLQEGFWGWSVGKRLLRLRVGTAADNRPPGVGRAFLRVAIFYFLLTFGAWVHTVVSVVYDLPANFEYAPKEQQDFVAWLGFGQGIYSLLALGVIISTMREKNGYRAMHEILSGTKTYRLHWPRPRKKQILISRPFDLDISQEPGIPERVGNYRVRGALRWNEREGTLMAEDTQLGRKLWLWLRPASEPSLDTSRRSISRATRIRWVSCGTQNSWQWDAFLAPGGMPLPALVEGERRLSWAEVRLILEDLTEELLASCAEGTLPHTLTLHQVWVEPNGRIQLLGTPLQGTNNQVKGLITSNENAQKNPGDQERALRFLREVAITALEGKPRPPGDMSGPVQAPVPVHAEGLLKELFQTGEPGQILAKWQKELEATRERATEVSRLRRFGHLVFNMTLLNISFGPILFSFLVFVFLMDYWEVYNLPEPGDLAERLLPAFPVIGFFLAMWVVWDFIFRGGYMFWRGGVHLRRADGGKPRRWQCAWRTFLLWLPVCALFTLATIVALLDPDLLWLYMGIWGLGVLLLLVYAVLAIIYPTRSIHDRLAGTYLVPD